MPRCDPRFQPLIDSFQADTPDIDAGTVYGMWADLTLAYLNDGWFRFAEANGGEPTISQVWSLGARLTDAMTADVASFYAQHYERCIEHSSVWQHEYECSSHDTYRRMRQIAYPLARTALLVVHAIIVERPHGGPACAPDPTMYRGDEGIIKQCSHCRRFRRVRQNGEPIANEVWDWVPAWVEASPVQRSHGLCPVCFIYYYPPE